MTTVDGMTTAELRSQCAARELRCTELERLNSELLLEKVTRESPCKK
jgi:hypothetical protein